MKVSLLGALLVCGCALATSIPRADDEQHQQKNRIHDKIDKGILREKIIFFDLESKHILRVEENWLKKRKSVRKAIDL